MQKNTTQQLTSSQASSIKLFVGCLYYLSIEARSEKLLPVSEIISDTIHNIQDWITEDKNLSEDKLLQETNAQDMLKIMNFLYQVIDVKKVNPEIVSQFISSQNSNSKKLIN